MDTRHQHNPDRPRRLGRWLAVVACVGAVVVFLTTREPDRPAVDWPTGIASATDAAPSEATLAAAPRARTRSTTSDGYPHLNVVNRIHLDLVKSFHLDAKRVAVRGTVVDADGRAVTQGRVDYRQQGGPWSKVQIDYDATFEVVDSGVGPYELVATQGNGPADRRAQPTTVGAGSSDVQLRAPHAGRLAIRLTGPTVERGRVYVSHRDAGDGLNASGYAEFDDGEHAELTGLAFNTAYVLWIVDQRDRTTYAYVTDVRTGLGELKVEQTESVPFEAMLRATELTNVDTLRLVGLGVDQRIDRYEHVQSIDLTSTRLLVDSTLPPLTYGVRVRGLYVPRVALRLVASGIRSDTHREANDRPEFDGRWKPGEKLVGDWKPAR